MLRDPGMAEPATSDRNVSTSSARSRRGHLVVYVSLAMLEGPASDVVSGRVPSAWLAGLALVAFVVCFVLLVEIARHPGSPPPHAPLSPRRRRLGTCLFAALSVLAVVATPMLGRSWSVLFVFVVVVAAFWLPVRRVPITIALVTLVAEVSVLVRYGTRVGLATIAALALSISMSGIVSLLMRRRNLLIQELRTVQSEVARLAAADAVGEERLRFARDLHDLLGHSLSVIALKAELARKLLERGADRARVEAEVGDLEQIARRALGEVRDAVTGYRARSLDTELAWARAALEAAGVEVIARIAAPPLPPHVDDLLAWVVREATTNIVRHSRARRVEIVLTGDGGIARLDVCNDGVGLDADTPVESAGIASDEVSGGSGLVGLRERVSEAGGRFTAVHEDGGAFRITAAVPLGAHFGPEATS